MSFDLGKDASFNPPPPPKRKMSPWAAFGIGCGVLLVGSIAGIGGCIAVVSNSIKEEMKKPVNKAQLLAELGDTPLYPNIQFDEQTSKAGRAGLKVFERIIPAQKVVAVGFRTSDSINDVYSWYEKKLGEVGFRPEEGRGTPRGGQAYRKNNEMIMIQANRSKGEANGIILMRFVGLKK